LKISDIDVLDHRKSEAAADDHFMARWSPRAMSGKPLSKEQMVILVEAARWAPSCFNLQPWRFVYSLKQDQYWDTYLALLMDMNRVWAEQAGALVVILSNDQFKDSAESSPTSGFDTGSAWMSMALQAQSMGLVSHAMWGFHHEKVRETIGAELHMTARALVAIGYPGDSETLPENYREKEIPSSRSSIDELMFNGML